MHIFDSILTRSGFTDSCHYAGIGSRETPAASLALMTKAAARLEARGFILRSGGADGADRAFESGADTDMREIYLPWKGFNGSTSPLFNLGNDALALEIASRLHPRWSHLKDSVRRLHARNVYQILGSSLNCPVQFVLCWTKDGVERHDQVTEQTGGTGTAIRLASMLGIPVFNMRNPDALQRLAGFLDAGLDNANSAGPAHMYHQDGSLPPKDGSWIFVFGSNLDGRHGKGAAEVARIQYGARYGEGRGLTGNAYAIATKGHKTDGSLPVLPIARIQKHIADFIEFARQNPHRKFFVTRVGCQLAGYSDSEIAPFFKSAPANCSFAEQWKPFIS